MAAQAPGPSDNTHTKYRSVVERNNSVLSATSTTNLIRSESQLSSGSTVDGFNGNSWTPSSPVINGMKSYCSALESVSESLEPTSIGRRTDPIHRRVLSPVPAESDWQRTLPSMNRRSGRRSNMPVAAETLEDFRNSSNDSKYRSPGFHESLDATGNGITSGGNAVDVDEDFVDEGVDAIWEKFDCARNMAIEVEMGSQAMVGGTGVTADSVLGEATAAPSAGVEAVQPAGTDMSAVDSDRIDKLMAEVI